MSFDLFFQILEFQNSLSSSIKGAEGSSTEANMIKAAEIVLTLTNRGHLIRPFAQGGHGAGVHFQYGRPGPPGEIPADPGGL
ncbi:MAG: hypothetical protein ACLFQY_14835 [Desulfococcaceae bacterium]